MYRLSFCTIYSASFSLLTDGLYILQQNKSIITIAMKKILVILHISGQYFSMASQIIVSLTKILTN